MQSAVRKNIHRLSRLVKKTRPKIIYSEVYIVVFGCSCWSNFSDILSVYAQDQFSFSPTIFIYSECVDNNSMVFVLVGVIRCKNTTVCPLFSLFTNIILQLVVYFVCLILSALFVWIFRSLKRFFSPKKEILP